MMSATVVIQSSNSLARLTLSTIENDLDYLIARIEDSDLQAEARIDASRAESLVQLFEGMAKEWRGWQGKFGAETIDGDLSLVCQSDSTGHTLTTVTLRPAKEDGWVASVTVRIDSGQYAHIAQQLRDLFHSGLRNTEA